MGIQNVTNNNHMPQQSLNKRLYEGMTKDDAQKKRSNNLNNHFGLADFDKNNVLDKFEIIRYDLITKKGVLEEKTRFEESLNILKQRTDLTKEDKTLIKKYEKILAEINVLTDSNKQKLLRELNIKEEDLVDKWPDLKIVFDQYGHLHSTDNKLRIDMNIEVACHKKEYQAADLDKNNNLDAFEIFRYDIKTLYPNKSEKEVMQEALDAYKYACAKFLHRNEKEVNYNVELIRHYEQIIRDMAAKPQQKQKLSNENVRKNHEMSQENVSFLDERWSGYQIAKLTGDNVVTDWLQNKDKVCTDGKDDGKIGFWEGAKSFTKGLIGGIPKVIINHPVSTAVTSGLVAAASFATGGAILPVLGAIGVATGIGLMGYGGYKTATAKTDGEAKMALETFGTGVTTTIVSANVLKKTIKTGVKSTQVGKPKTERQSLLSQNTKTQPKVNETNIKLLKKYGIKDLTTRTVRGKEMIVGYIRKDGTYIQIKPVVNNENGISGILSKLAATKVSW